MSCLDLVLENDSMKQYLENHEAEILGITEELMTFPQSIKNYVEANLDKFIGATVAETHDNIACFTEQAMVSYLDEMVDIVVE